MDRKWRAAALTASALGLSGCSTVPKLWAKLQGPRAELTVTPLKLQAATAAPAGRSDRAYAAARAAILRRDYPLALDMLQLAREDAPRDARVLNALGVVYDKLGRFDLSARYYTQALIEEPNSAIVQANLSYSDRLEQATHASAKALASAPPAPAPTFSQAVASAAPINRVPAAAPFRLASSTVAPKLSSTLVGSPLLVINAAGRPGAQEPVRRYLADAGWSVQTQLQIRPAQAQTEIRFPAANRRVAEALARTLPFHATLSECATMCSGLELLVGADAAASKVRS